MNIKSKVLQVLGLDGLIENVKNMIEARTELFKLQIQEHVAKILVKIIPLFILILFLFLLIFFVSFSIGFYLSDLLNNNFYGFGLVAAFYLLLTIILLAMRNSSAVSNYFTAKIMATIAEDEKKTTKDE